MLRFVFASAFLALATFAVHSSEEVPAQITSGARTIIIGDSIMAALSTHPAPWYNTLSSIVDWGNFYSGSRLYVIQGGNRAKGGDATDVIDQKFVANIGSSSPQLIIANGGVNDGEDVAVSDIVANWDSMIAKSRQLGAQLIILPVLPASTETELGIGRRSEINAALLERAAVDVHIVDVTGYDYQTMTYAENGAFGPAGVRIHPNVVGAQFLGQRLAEIIETIVAPAVQTPVDQGNLLGYGAMAGTEGSTDEVALGEVADGWELWGAESGGATVNGSKVSDDLGEWQQVEISGVYSGDGRTVQLTAGFDLDGRPLLQYETMLEIEVVGARNIDSVGVLTYLFNEDYSVTTFSSIFQNNTANNSGGYDVGDFGGRVRVMPVSLEAAPRHARITITAFLREGGNLSQVSGTFRVRQVTMKPAAP